MHKKKKTNYLFLHSSILFFLLFGCTPTTQAVRPTPEPTPTIVYIEDVFKLLTTSEYLKECKSIYSKHPTNQISYKGILPEKSTKQDVENFLGPPLDIKEGLIETWEYNDELGIVFEDSFVKSIWIHNDTDVLLPLEQIVESYGCPDIVIAYDLNEHPSGNAGMTSFVYHNIGLEINYYSFPVNIDQKPDQIIFEKKETLSEYLERMKDVLEIPNKTIFPSWYKTVIK